MMRGVATVPTQTEGFTQYTADEFEFVTPDSRLQAPELPSNSEPCACGIRGGGGPGVVGVVDTQDTKARRCSERGVGYVVCFGRSEQIPHSGTVAPA